MVGQPKQVQTSQDKMVRIVLETHSKARITIEPIQETIAPSTNDGTTYVTAGERGTADGYFAGSQQKLGRNEEIWFDAVSHLDHIPNPPLQFDDDSQSLVSSMVDSIFGTAAEDDSTALSDANSILQNGYEIQSVVLPGQQRTSDPVCFADCLFGDRLVTVNLQKSNNYNERANSSSRDMDPVRAEYVDHGRKYQLLLSKYHKSSKEISLRYVLVKSYRHGECLPEIDLERQLNKIGDFGKLTARKCASRLELFHSPALKGRGDANGSMHLVFHDLKRDDFELIDEYCHEGCGFIPRSYLDRFLAGSYCSNNNVASIQVRIFSPVLGVFKGVLMEKRGVTRIQLPTSMRKVGPSRTSNENVVWLLVTQLFPSLKSQKIGNCLMDPWGAESVNQKEVPEMICDLWTYLGASKRGIAAYNERIVHSPSHLKHNYMAGVADSTNAIPQGCVFIPGLDQHLPRNCQHIIATRMPCITPSDIVKVPILRSRPSVMSLQDWEWLKNIPFGMIIFGNSIPGNRPLPNCVAEGDLDGDLYFVCWSNEIITSVSSLQPELSGMKVDDPGHPSSETPRDLPVQSEEWLSRAQHVAGNLATVLDMQIVIGLLYNASKDLANESSQSFGDRDAISLGKAFIKAIDLQKHGGKVPLPEHLWKYVRVKRLHKYLEPLSSSCPMEFNAPGTTPPKKTSPRSKSKYYAVAVGRKSGIYSTWEECQKQVKGYGKAKFKSFTSRADAESFCAQCNGEPRKNERGQQPQKQPCLRKRMQFKMSIHYDGASRGNPGEAGCGALITVESTDGPFRRIVQVRRYLGLTTNNVAEYKGVISALEEAKQQIDGIDGDCIQLIVKGDSEFVTKQVNGDYACQTLHLVPLLQEVKDITSSLNTRVVFEHVYRSENKEADSKFGHVLVCKKYREFLI